MADISTEGFADAIESVERLADNLDGGGMARHVDDEADRLKSAIRKQIQRRGLVDSGELLSSFVVKQTSDNSWTVFSTEEHADYLEHGTSPHTIRPDTAPVLAWQPENPASYTSTDELLPGNRTGNYDPETGYVYAMVVEHPGNEAYEFVEDAQRAWAAGLLIGLRGAVRKEIVKAGFTPGVK